MTRKAKLALAGSLLFLVSACAEEAPVSAPAPVTKKVAPQAGKPAATGVKNEDAVKVREYSYDPLGRRDPFAPLLVVRPPTFASTEPQTPLQSFELGQLRLIAIIVGKGPASAMVMAPDGKGYILKKGIKVGKNSGKVIDINPEAVLVEENYLDFSGEVRTKTQEIQLPKREGA
ncbi:MAG: pilus assembly protein PilP [Saccharofermentanales bacterium]|jgi:type IV pilus assembly protein PilP